MNIASTAHADLTPPEMDILFDCTALGFSTIAQVATYVQEFGGSDAEAEEMNNDIMKAMEPLAEYEARLSDSQKESYDGHVRQLWDSVKPFEDGFIIVNRNRSQYRDRLNRNIQGIKDCSK